LWQSHLANKLGSMGWRRSLAEPQLYWKDFADAAGGTPQRVLMSIHADDTLLAGADLALERAQAEIEANFAYVRTGFIGDEWCRYLGLQWRRASETSAEVGLDPQWVDRMLAESGLERCKAVGSPGSPAASSGNDTPLSQEEHVAYRRLVGQLQWMAMTRPDIQFAVKEAARSMAKPTADNAAQLKRVLRYLQGSKTEVLKLQYDAEAAQGMVECYTDASMAPAGDRKSTSAASIWYEGVNLCTFSRTQGSIALSSCESELYACSSGAQEAKFASSVLQELGEQARIRIFTDAGSTLALSHKRGLGRLKHVETRHLWLQDEVAAKRLQIARVSTLLNPADVGTKHVAPVKLRALKRLIGVGPSTKVEEANPVRPTLAALQHLTPQVVQMLVDQGDWVVRVLREASDARRQEFLVPLAVPPLTAGLSSSASASQQRLQGQQEPQQLLMLQQAARKPEPVNFCGRCGFQMEIEISDIGLASWRCGQCGSTQSWPDFVLAQQTPPTYSGSSAAAAAAVEPPVLPSSSATRWSARRLEQPLGGVDKTEQQMPSLVGFKKSIVAPDLPTDRQTKYLEDLAKLLGYNPKEIVDAAKTKAQATALITQLQDEKRLSDEKKQKERKK
jgi:hypothetical protein